MLTVLSNRVEDVALLIVIAWILNFGSWNYVYYLDFLKGSIEIDLISLLVVLAAMTKSAQIPFSSWLPAAITPIHTTPPHPISLRSILVLSTHLHVKIILLRNNKFEM
jgi:NADH-ubiquinone oxidoreductase chain 5